MDDYRADDVPEDELHPTVRACAMRSFCDATFAAAERRMETIHDLDNQLRGAVSATVEALRPWLGHKSAICTETGRCVCGLDDALSTAGGR